MDKEIKVTDENEESVCPYCNQPIKEFELVGRCVYAKPCNHRLGQIVETYLDKETQNPD